MKTFNPVTRQLFLISAIALFASADVASAGPFQRRARANYPPAKYGPGPIAQRIAERRPRLAQYILPSYPQEVAPYGYSLDGPLPPQRFPRLAAMAMPGGILSPGYYAPPLSDSEFVRPIPRLVLAFFNVVSYLPLSIEPVGLAVSPTIRATHVLMNGSPSPGRPLDTALWVAIPWTARLRANFRDWRASRGLPPIVGPAVPTQPQIQYVPQGSFPQGSQPLPAPNVVPQSYIVPQGAQPGTIVVPHTP